MMANLAEADEEEVRLEEEQEAKLAELEAEMENEKEARKLAGATEEEIQRAMELLKKQHDAKRKVNFLFWKIYHLFRLNWFLKRPRYFFCFLECMAKNFKFRQWWFMLIISREFIHVIKATSP